MKLVIFFGDLGILDDINKAKKNGDIIKLNDLEKIKAFIFSSWDIMDKNKFIKLFNRCKSKKIQYIVPELFEALKIGNL